MQNLLQKFESYTNNAKSGILPQEICLFELLENTIAILSNKNVNGLAEAPVPAVPIIVIPDIHGRVEFLLSIFKYTLPASIFPGTVFDALMEKKVCIVCVGDGIHGEGRVKKRWQDAYKKYQKGKINSIFMMHEMAENLAVMCMIMEAKIAFPNFFHFLKGNHENILNEQGNGNYPFRKFALEGEMTYSFMLSEFGKEVVLLYAKFEHMMPLMFRGSNVLVSHAQPIRAFSVEEIQNGRCNHEIVTGLTWTANDVANETAVSTMLKTWLSNSSDAVYLGGHRPVTGKYALRCDGRYIQIHNPDTWGIAIVSPNKKFNPETDIVYTDEKYSLSTINCIID
ncbi:MAG: hypothetical protein BKP49_08475 [Treponema sp. CETP13]|nr:MAG: hypothetical protein BKP49_08475 [Treponema sp. CETP13]